MIRRTEVAQKLYLAFQEGKTASMLRKQKVAHQDTIYKYWRVHLYFKNLHKQIDKLERLYFEGEIPSGTKFETRLEIPMA